MNDMAQCLNNTDNTGGVMHVHGIKPGFHYPSWRQVNSASGNRAPVNTVRADG